MTDRSITTDRMPPDDERAEPASSTIVKHIVMWNVRGDTAAQRAAAFDLIKSRFERLRGRIPGLLKIEIGVDISRTDYSCDVMLYSEFDSELSLKNYNDHPDHLAIRADIAGIRTARYQVDFLSHP